MHCGSFFICEVLDPLVGLYVYLHVLETSIIFGEFIGMTGISIHVPV
jgi:hypothetical protein